MSEFKSASLWMRLAFLFSIIAWGTHMFSMDTPGWANHACGYGNSNAGCGFYSAVEAMEVIGYLCLLTATVLIVCLVLLDELKGNKPALICYVIFSFIAGLTMIIGVAVYEGQAGLSATYATMLCVMAAICAILGGIFGVLELTGTKA